MYQDRLLDADTVRNASIALSMRQLAVLSSAGIDVSEMLDALAGVLDGTKEASPEGLVDV